MAISAKLTDGNNTRVVKVTVPGPQGTTGERGISGADATQLSALSDVDSTAVADGSILIYKSSNSKWTAKNDVEADSGTITISGGNF